MRRLATYAELVEVIEALPFLVRDARRARGMTLRDVATETGLGHTSVARVEHGRGCWTSTAVILLRWLDRSAP